MDYSALQQINVNQLRVFSAVYKKNSMTLAAQDLFLTQSGVSQHIKSLETELGVPLFVRNAGEIFSTTHADQLFLACDKAFREIENSIQSIRAHDVQGLRGTIKIGVPTEFGNNVVIPLLSEWGKTHPETQIEVVYGYSTEMQQQLESGKLDLAFIDSLRPDRKVAGKSVYFEGLSLVVAESYLKDKGITLGNGKQSLKQLLQLDYLEYEHNEPVLRMWFNRQYNKKNVPLQIRVWTLSVNGIASFVRSGMGAAILPDHLLNQLRAQGAGVRILLGPKGSVINEISLAWSAKKPLSAVAESCKTFLLKAKISQPQKT